MSRTLTWEYLSPVHVNRAQTAPDAATVRRVLEEADSESKAGYFDGLTPTQVQILLDMFFHLLRFAKTQNMTSEKISTLVSVVYRTNRDSMAQHATMHQSYRILESYIIAHSVHRPPYSAAVFAVDDVKHINDYLLATYYRHYKLYFFAFTKRAEATVTTVVLGACNEVPPTPPPLSKAVPLAQWEADQRAKEEADVRARRAAEAEAAARLAEEQRLAGAADGPPMSAGLKQQVDGIRSAVLKMSADKLDALEAKLVALEGRVADANKPSSAVAGKAPPRAGAKK